MAQQTQTTVGIEPLFALALITGLRKGVDGETAREATSPGVYRNLELDVTLSIKEMRVGHDTDKAPTASISLLATCALLLAKKKVTLDELREVLTEAHGLSSDAQKRLLQETGCADLERRIKEEIIADLPRVPVKGAVSIKPEDVKVTLRRMSRDG